MINGVVLVGVDAEVAHGCADQGLTSIEIEGGDAWVASGAARVMQAFIEKALQAPLLVVCAGNATAELPAFSMSQRAAGRLIAAYLLIDPQTTARTDIDWPDAPVTVMTHDVDIARVSRLRGWRVLETTNLADISETIAAIAAGE